MTDPIFVRTRFDYVNPENGFGSYQDYWRLVELSHFPTCYVDEMDTASDNVYIISPLNGEIPQEDGKPLGYPGARARIIHWNLEQSPYPKYPGINETWVSDARLAECTNDGKYLLMGSHEGLRYPGEIERTEHFDTIMLAYMTPRRDQIAVSVREEGLTIAPNGWGLDRHKSLISTSTMLHVHQNDGKAYCAPQRFALAAAYSLPLITEMLDHPGKFGHGHMLSAAYEYLAPFVRVWTRRNEARILEGYGESLHQFLCHQWPFRKCVENAL